MSVKSTLLGNSISKIHTFFKHRYLISYTPTPPVKLYSKPMSGADP